MKRIICWILGHDDVLKDFKGPLGVDSTWKCRRCGSETGTEVEVNIRKKHE